MHLLIAFITAVASLLFALDRLGVDIGWLNPWAWRRRRKWRMMATGNPAFQLGQPIDVIALLAAATAKIDGDISIEEKDGIKLLFQNTFDLSEAEATKLLGASVYLLGSGEGIYENPEKVIEPCLEKFSAEQKKLSIDLIRSVMDISPNLSDIQVQFFQRIEKELSLDERTSSW